MISKNEAVTMLVQLFNENKLTFRDIEVLKQAFDSAVEACDEDRSEQFAGYCMGRGAHPTLPSRDVENDFYSTKEAQVATKLGDRGIKTSDRALSALAEIVVEEAEYSPQDFFFS